MNERYKILSILRQQGYHHAKSQCIRGRSAPAGAYKIICTRPGAAANHIPVLSPRRKMHALTSMSPRNMQHNPQPDPSFRCVITRRSRAFVSIGMSTWQT
jgi:hypothetical protein